MKRTLLIGFGLFLVTGPRAFSQCECNFPDMFSQASSISTPATPGTLSLIQGTDLLCLNPDTNYPVLAKGADAIRCGFMEMETQTIENAPNADDDSAEGRARLEAHEEQLSQLSSLLDDINDCRNQLFFAVRAAVLPARPVARPVIPKPDCNCELKVLVDGEFKVLNGRFFANPNELIRFEAECEPDGGTYTW